MFEIRTCPICGEAFTPKKASQIYDKDYCRTKASRARRKADAAPVDQTGMLDEMRRLDPETARDIQRVATLAGTKVAEEVLLICWRAMNRAARRLNHEERLLAENRLISSGSIAPRKERKPNLDMLNRRLETAPVLAGYFVEREAGKGLFLRRMNGNQKETKAFLGTYAKAEKWIDETISSGKPNYAALRTN